MTGSESEQQESGGANTSGGLDRLRVEPTVDPTARIIASELGEWTEVRAQTELIESTLGDYSYVMQHGQITYTTIGKFCSIASYVRINPGNHPIDRPTSHHMTYRAVAFGFADHDEDEFFDWRRKSWVNIGHDVWIGHNASIMPGVTVGNGAVIGTGAVVTKDVEPYSIVVGVPAKKVRMRFDDDVIAKLEAMQWWDWSRETLEERFVDFRDMDAFLANYGNA